MPFKVLTRIVIADAAEIDLVEYHRIADALRVDRIQFDLVGGARVDPKHLEYRRTPSGGDVVFRHHGGVLEKFHLEALGETAVETFQAFDLQRAVCVVGDGAVD